MAGFFNSVGAGESSGNEFDFARNGSTNPGAVPSTGFYDRLFGHKRKPGASGGDQMGTPLAPSGSPAHTPAVAEPSITSGPGLVKRILASVNSPPSYNVNGQPLVPGMDKTVPELLQDFGKNTEGIVSQARQALASAAQPAGGPSQMRLPMPMPPAPAPGLPPGTGPAPRPMGPPQPRLPMPLPPGGAMPGRAHGGFFARGGYPAHLMMGMPMRRAHGGGDENYVPDDGTGDGRSDNVNARLSPGEYVMDAETVSMLGNGSNRAGADKLDAMRHNVRKQKGRALVKGKFSPDAKKDALAYLRGGSSR